MIGVFFLALIIRELFSLLAPGQYQTFGDTAEYIETAKIFCSVGSYPFAHIALPTFRAPGFPLLLAILSGCFNSPEWWTNFCLILLDSFACLLGAAIVFRVSSNNKTNRAVCFGIAYACYPLFVQQSVAVQSESLTLLAILAALFLLSKAYDNILFKSYVKYAVGAGIMLGIAILTRPSALFILCPLFISFFLSGQQYKKCSLLAIFGIALTVLPWSIYASINTGRLTLVNDSFCYSFYRGSRLELIDVYNATDRLSFDNAAQKSELAIRDAEHRIENSDWCKATVSEIQTHNHLQDIKLAFLKWWAFFRPWPHQGAHSVWIVYVIGSIVIALYLWFFLTLWQVSESKNQRLIKWIAVSYIIFISLLHVPHQVSNRYRVPFVDPIMMIMIAAYWKPKSKIKIKDQSHLT